MPEFIININDESQFSNEEKKLYDEINNCLKAIGPKYMPNLALENFKVAQLKESRSTDLQKSIVNNVLIPMHYRATCWDITSVFYGYYGIHRILQRHYLAINLALKILHGDGKKKNTQNTGEANKVDEEVEAPSALFLKLMDFELLDSLRSMSQAGVLPYSVLQFVVAKSVDHDALLRKGLGDGVWRLNCMYKRDAFKEDRDSVEIQLEDAEVRNQNLRSRLNTYIKNYKDLELRILELEQVIAGLQSELLHYKDKKPSFIKQAKKVGAAVAGVFSSSGRSKDQESYEVQHTYEVINLS